MNIKDCAQIETLMFQSKFKEALAQIQKLETGTLSSDESLLLILKKIQVRSLLGDYSEVGQIIRELLEPRLFAQNKKPGNLTSPLTIDPGLISALNIAYCDSLVATGQSEVLSKWLASLREAGDPAFSDAAALYTGFATKAPTISSTTNIEEKVICEFKEEPLEIELRLRFENENRSMENFRIVLEPASRRLELIRPDGKTEFGMILSEKATILATKFDPVGRDISAVLRKEEPCKVWKTLNRDSNCEHSNKITYVNLSERPELKSQAKDPKKDKDWDRFVKDEEERDIKEKNFDCDPALHFFKQVYAGADEDARRAMLRSFELSGGKALSTNWEDVRNKDFVKEKELS